MFFGIREKQKIRESNYLISHTNLESNQNNKNTLER